jgi:hypothetical protein
MSAYKKIECEIVDKNSLLSALSSLGFKPICYTEPEQLTGYKGDKRNDKANIIIPKDQVNHFTGASNDIGFLWDAENKKYEMIVSDYDQAHKMHDRIIQSYVKVVLEEALAKNGFKIKVNVEDDILLQRRITDLNIVARKII